MIEIVVLGNPIAQKRHRSTRIGNGIRNYDPSAKDKEDLLRVIQEKAPEELFKGPLKVDVVCYFPRPKSHYGTGTKSSMLKENAPQWHISKPDRDNCDKFILDSMKGVFWSDDSIVCAGSIMKLYSDKPRTEITITEL